MASLLGLLINPTPVFNKISKVIPVFFKSKSNISQNQSKSSKKVQEFKAKSNILQNQSDSSKVVQVFFKSKSNM